MRFLGAASISMAMCFRSKGPVVSSPVREGGDPIPFDTGEA